MAAVPLSGFPPEFRVRCFKCNASNVHFSQSRHPFMWGKAEVQFNCYICGSVKYGEVAIRQVFEPLLKLWEREQAEEKEAQERLAALAREEAERALQREREEREREEAARLAREVEAARLRAEQDVQAEQARKEKERAVLPPATTVAPLCAWQECSNPAASASKYCSRACSNNNARARYKARHSASLLFPVASDSGEGVDAELRKAVLSRKAHYGTRTTTESA
jgi:hypothetical protein